MGWTHEWLKNTAIHWHEETRGGKFQMVHYLFSIGHANFEMPVNAHKELVIAWIYNSNECLKQEINMWKSSAHRWYL